MSNQNSAKPLTELEASMFTLWSLYILIDQHFKAIVHYRSILDNDNELASDTEVYIDTIYEALVHQILLKTCSFIEEWDKVFGPLTEPVFKEKVTEIKQIAKPARKFLNTWKGLKEYRNQAIAHNHRDKEGNNIYVSRKAFHTPVGIGEMALMIFCIEKMAKIAGGLLYTEFQRAITHPFQNNSEYDNSGNPPLGKFEIINSLNKIEAEITSLFKEKTPNIENVTSDYGDFLRVAK